MWIYCMAAYTLTFQKTRKDGWSDDLIVLTHWVCNEYSLIWRDMHVVDILLLGTKIVVHHFLEAQAGHNILDLS